MDIHDLFVMLLMSLRYSLRRNDGSVMTFERLVQTYGQQLELIQRQQLIREIAEMVVGNSFSDVAVQRGWESIAGQLATMEGDKTHPSAEERTKLIAGDFLGAIKAVRARLGLGLREGVELTRKWRDDPVKYDLGL